MATGGSIALDPEGKRVLSASVGQMFMAGVIPGLMLATMLGMTTWYRAWKNDYPRMPKATWVECFDAFRKSIWGLLLIVIVLGGIYSGAFTPTEAAAMSAVYAFVIAVFVYKDMGLKDVPRVLLGSANMSAMILYIVTNAVLFSFLMTSEQIPQQMIAWVTGSGLTWIEFLLFVNILLLVAGNVMEPSSIVLITAPILFPVAVALGIHPVHLGILMTVNMEVGLCHPPVGLNLYVASGIAKMGITELTIAVWPWLADHAGVPGDRDLCAGIVAVAAARRDARDAFVTDLSKLTPGLEGHAEIVVGEQHTAPRIGSGRVRVLATPVMINLMEAAALDAAENLIPAGHQSLGTRLDVRHIAATPVGMRVRATREAPFGRWPHPGVPGRGA